MTLRGWSGSCWGGERALAGELREEEEGKKKRKVRREKRVCVVQ